MCVLLNSAYDTLTDPEERAYYDRQLAKAMLDDEDGYTGGCARACRRRQPRTGASLASRHYVDPCLQPCPTALKRL